MGQSASPKGGHAAAVTTAANRSQGLLLCSRVGSRDIPLLHSHEEHMQQPSTMAKKEAR